jgi:hypothetical protein
MTARNTILTGPSFSERHYRRLLDERKHVFRLQPSYCQSRAIDLLCFQAFARELMIFTSWYTSRLPAQRILQRRMLLDTSALRGRDSFRPCESFGQCLSVAD